MTIKSNKKEVAVDVFEVVANSALAEASKKPSPLTPVDVVDSVGIGRVVELFAQGEDDIFAGETKVRNSANGMAKILGDSPSYDYWENCRKAFELAYRAKYPKFNEETANKAWTRIAKVMEKEFGLSKPKAPSKAAQGMSEKRAKEKAHMESLVDSQLHEAIAGFVQLGNFSEAAKYQNEVKRRDKIAGKSSDEAFKLERKLISRCIWKITDPARIAEIRALIPNAVYDEIKADYEANVLKGQAIAK